MMAIRDAVEKLMELRNLPVGWNYGAGAPLSREAHTLSVVTLQVLGSFGASRFDVVPSADGGATLFASLNGELAEIVIRKDGRIDLFLEAEECQEFENLGFGELLRKLEDAGWRSPKSSGSQTHFFTVESTEDLPVRLSPNWVRAHLSLQQNAFKRRAIHFASTWTDSTEESEDCPLSFGASPQKHLLQAHG